MASTFAQQIASEAAERRRRRIRNPLLHGTAKDGNEWTVTASHFGVAVDDYESLGLFRKVSGLGVTIQVESVVEGGQNDYVHKLPGAMQWQDLELERGLVHTDKMYEWIAECSGTGLKKGQVPRKNGHITMFSADNKPLRVWAFVDAFPVSWTGPSFDVDSDTALTEKLVLTHAGLSPTTKSNG